MDTQHNIIKLYKMNIHEKRVDQINRSCWHIFNEYGGYDYNDWMLSQLHGLRDSIAECEDDAIKFGDKAWEGMVEEAETTYTWFLHIKKIRVLQENIPTSLYC
jgi:hypothetical protein